MKSSKKLASLLIPMLLLLSMLLTSCDPFYGGLFDPDEQSSTPSQSETQSQAPENESASAGEQGSEGILPEGEAGTADLSHASAHALRSVAMVVACFSPQKGSTTTHYSYGTAVLYSVNTDGGAFFVTNYHVVYDQYAAKGVTPVSSEIYLYLYGKTLEAYAINASFVGGSSFYDLAVLYVPTCDVLSDALADGSVTPVTVADSDAISPGDTALAIGCPTSTDIGGFSVTRGIVSVVSEYIDMTAIDSSATVTMRVIRTDTAVNSGNSGGGLFNARGELIGIVNAKSIVTDIDGIGYAIPSNVVRAIADNIVDYCYEKDCNTVMRCILGITVTVNGQRTEYDEESGRILRYEDVCVTAVSKGTLADGLFLADDVIESITVGDRTVTVTRQHHLIDAMLDARPSDEVTFLLRRGDKKVSFTVVITENCLTAY